MPTHASSAATRLAIEIIRHPRNLAVWERIGVRDNILVEQDFLCACLEAAAADASRAVRPAYLFASSADAFDPAKAEKVGYTHLIGDPKADPAIAERLEARVKAAYPGLYARCLDVIGKPAG